MDKYIFGDQVKIYFQDGSTVTAQVISEDGNNLECSALSKNEVYKEGDSIFVDKKNSKIEKLNLRKMVVRYGDKVIDRDTGNEWYVLNVQNETLMLCPYGTEDSSKEDGIIFKNINEVQVIPKDEYLVDDDYGSEDEDFENQTFSKKARTFNWEFDKHKPQWKINKESMEIERDDDAVTKIAKLRNKLNYNYVGKGGGNNRKIDFFYVGKNGKNCYLFSSNSYKTVKEGIQRIKEQAEQYPMTWKPIVNKVKEECGEDLDINRIKGSFSQGYGIR